MQDSSSISSYDDEHSVYTIASSDADVLRQAVREHQSVQEIQSILESAQIDTQDLMDVARASLQEEQDDSNHIAVLRLLINYDPQLPFLRDMYENCILHIACEENVPIQVIQYLLEVNPEAVFIPNQDGELPLHLACSSKDSSVETVKFLLSKYPNGVRRVENSIRKLPLHSAALFDAPEEVILALLKEYPQGAGARDSHGNLPIDFMYKRVNVVRKVVEHCPECICLSDNDGDLPLHRALRQEYPQLDVIEFLVDKYPASVKVSGRFGHLPLHLAVTDCSMEIVQFLLASFSGGLHVQDNDGKLPIHVACEKRSLDIVQLLIESDNRQDAGLDVVDNLGRLCLHYACLNTASREVPDIVRFVLERHREGAYAVDNDGMLPLHVVCLRRYYSGTNNLEMMRMFLEVDLLLILRMRHDGKTPLQLACSPNHRQPRETRKFLLKKQDEALALLHESFLPTVMHYNLPDLVVAEVWAFVMNKPWRPTKDEVNA